MDGESKFLRPSGPFLVSKDTSTGALAFSAERVEQKLGCLRVDGNGFGISRPVDMEQGRSDARVEAVEQGYLFTLDLQELHRLRFAVHAVGYQLAVW